MTPFRNTDDDRPLTARSVLLSTLLGAHPPELPVQVLVRSGELFGMAEGTVRVALS
ncbi:MAG: PaaX domain-containing protein, C- domain protein, partial [Actinomycetota bacterium]|nr:PaaX domain-containing protein, C- domain protein [Actinomycetota bacterium]